MIRSGTTMPIKFSTGRPIIKGILIKIKLRCQYHRIWKHIMEGMVCNSLNRFKPKMFSSLVSLGVGAMLRLVAAWAPRRNHRLVLKLTVMFRMLGRRRPLWLVHQRLHSKEMQVWSLKRHQLATTDLLQEVGLHHFQGSYQLKKVSQTHLLLWILDEILYTTPRKVLTFSIYSRLEMLSLLQLQLQVWWDHRTRLKAGVVRVTHTLEEFREKISVNLDLDWDRIQGKIIQIQIMMHLDLELLLKTQLPQPTPKILNSKILSEALNNLTKITIVVKISQAVNQLVVLLLWAKLAPQWAL